MLVSVAIDDHRHVANVSAQAAALPDDFARGQYYFNHGDRADGTYDLVAARHYFSRAIQADPDGNPLAWYQLGRIDFIEGKFDAAIYKFNKQLQYFGDQVPNVYYMLGLTYGFRGRVEAPDSPDLQTGIENFEKYLEFFPDSPWARTDIAWLHFLQGEYAAMIPVLDSGLAIEPDHAWLLNMYGLALLNTGNRTEAQEAFTQAKVSAEALTTADWGRAYPGNNPADWQWGLDSFRAAIEQNIDLAEAPSQS
jgi:Tfp pilus assembly protein PilF